MKRRRLLSIVPGAVLVTPGCSGRSPSDDDTPSRRPTETATTSPTPIVIRHDAAGGTEDGSCESAFESGTPPDDDCDEVEFIHAWSSPRSTATTSAGETPYEGTFDDFLVVGLSIEGDEPFDLRGCIEGLDTDGDGEITMDVSHTLDAGGGEVELWFGPFAHPGGVASWDLWIVGCDARISSSRSA